MFLVTNHMGVKHLIRNSVDLIKYAILHQTFTCDIIDEWTPPIEKEPRTKKDRADDPKEPIPLSRFIEE